MIIVVVSKNLKILAFTVALGFANVLPAQAQHQDNPTTVNGMPCIEEVCIGDDLKNLGHINWNSADPSIKRASSKVPRNLAIGNAADIQAFAPYWNSQNLDTKSIKILSRIKGFCIPPLINLFYADYTNKSGKPVMLVISISTSPDGKTQRWIVRDIFKTIYIGATTDMQRQDLEAQIKAKYPSFAASPTSAPSVRLEVVSVGVGLRLSMPSWGPNALRGANRDNMLQFPGCGGDQKIKL
jgi:hypothetical protein